MAIFFISLFSSFFITGFIKKKELSEMSLNELGKFIILWVIMLIIVFVILGSLFNTTLNN
jgi:hypothetical protein